MIENSQEEVKKEVEKMLISLGFEPVTVKLEQPTNRGVKEVECYNREDLFCRVTFFGLNNTLGEFKNWVLIEYANSLYKAERWIFEDGDAIPLDIPLEQILSELKEEVSR